MIIIVNMTPKRSSDAPLTSVACLKCQTTGFYFVVLLLFLKVGIYSPSNEIMLFCKATCLTLPLSFQGFFLLLLLFSLLFLWWT